jgi:hypothetical protein
MIILSCDSDLELIIKNSEKISQPPQIKPDFSGVTIPPNIAPLNFFLQDSGTAGIAVISSDNGKTITVRSKKNRFFIDPKQWKRLLSENSGNDLHINVCSCDKQGKWRRYETYNVAEFAVVPVRFSERQLLKAIQSRKTISVTLPRKMQNR